MITYDGWDREYKENQEQYLKLFDSFMNQTNYENAEFFEKSFAERIGRKYAVSVASATDALHFALLAYKIGVGDEVLVTNFSWISSASCISMTGATPVFCDIDIDSYHMSLESIKRMYSKKTKALIYTPLFGNMTDTSEILNFCKEKGIAFIEDSAQALGSSLNGVLAGTIGDSSVFSFNTNKVVAGINGGGILVTDDSEIAEQVCKIRRHGKSTDFSALGFNSRTYVLNAKIINFRLERAEETRVKREKIAQQYNLAFLNLPIITPTSVPGLVHNYHKYVIRFTDTKTRLRVKDQLTASIHYETPLSKNSMYTNIFHRRDNCVNSNIASSTVLSLPVHAWLTDVEVTSIINIVKETI
jgi:perosamine synthetase